VKKLVSATDIGKKMRRGAKKKKDEKENHRIR